MHRNKHDHLLIYRQLWFHSLKQAALEPWPCLTAAEWRPCQTRHSSATDSTHAISSPTNQTKSINKIHLAAQKHFTVRSGGDYSVPCHRPGTGKGSETLQWSFSKTSDQTDLCLSRTDGGTVGWLSRPHRDQQPLDLVYTDRKITTLHLLHLPIITAIIFTRTSVYS